MFPPVCPQNLPFIIKRLSIQVIILIKILDEYHHFLLPHRLFSHFIGLQKHEFALNIYAKF